MNLVALEQFPIKLGRGFEREKDGKDFEDGFGTEIATLVEGEGGAGIGDEDIGGKFGVGIEF